MSKSKLINIPHGTMFWDKPLMQNLYTLEQMINDIDIGDGGSIGDIQSQINKIEGELLELQELHGNDVDDIMDLIDKLNNQVDAIHFEEIVEDIDKVLLDIQSLNDSVSNIIDAINKMSTSISSHDTQIQDLTATVQFAIENIASNTASIESLQSHIVEIYEILESIEGGTGGLPTEWIQDVEDTLDELISTSSLLSEKIDVVSVQVTEIENTTNENAVDIANILKDIEAEKSKLNKLNNKVEGLDARLVGFKALVNTKIDTIEKDVANIQDTLQDILDMEIQIDFVVDQVDDMIGITGMTEGSLCYVRSSGALYIYDDKWVKISSGVNKTVNWKDIEGAPKSSAAQIDESVKDSHDHNNHAALDRLTNAKMLYWDTKADKEDIPSDISDLNDDMHVGQIPGIKESVDKINLLSSENKDEIAKMNELLEDMSKNMIYISKE